MSKAEHEYKIIGFGETLNNPVAATDLLAKQTEEGWDVQQIFTRNIAAQGEQTLALLKRKK
jgi:hypothetical protein